MEPRRCGDIPAWPPGPAPTRAEQSVGEPRVTTGPIELLLLLGDPRGLAASFPRGSKEPQFIFLDAAVYRIGAYLCSTIYLAVTAC